MDVFKKFVYVIGPNADKNEQFIGTHFSVELSQIPEIIKTTTEMVDPEDAIHVYVIIDDNEDWLFHYSSKKGNIVLVKDF